MKPLMFAVLISACLPTAFAKEAATHLPKLAVAVSSQGPGPNRHDRENLEDLLIMKLANQSFLQLVDRQTMHAVIKEHAIALSNLNSTKSDLVLGRFAGADYLLHVLVEKKTAAIRLVEVATGQVKLEEQVALADDLVLSSVAIREKVLAALHPESQAANRLTVGIAAFPNRSGTDRSDKLGIELQNILRSRLKDQPWAVVLERQYPTSLLEEIELSRAGLVRENAVEKLPPADLVISGTLEDLSKEYVADRPWEIKFDLTLRLRDKSGQIVQTCRSDSVEAAADRIMEKIGSFRRQPTAPTAVAEKELWRRQALYFMPRQIETWRNNVLIPNFAKTNELNQSEVIRAWENVLLLDDKDPEAMNYLGNYLISCNRWLWNYSGVSMTKKRASVAQCVAGSRLVERALKTQPSKERAASYVFCIRPLMRVAPARAKEMAEYVFDHPKQFEWVSHFHWIKVAQTRPVRKLNVDHYAELDRVLANAEQDPNAVLIVFPPRLTRKGPVKQYGELLKKYLDSPDPVVQFVVHRALGELLCWQKRDPSSLEHFDAAIAVMEKAYERCKRIHRRSLDDIYRHKIEACQHLDQPEEAKKTALAGAKHFMENGRFGDFGNPIARLYRYCVAEALGKGEEKQALAICDTYFAHAKEHLERHSDWTYISAKREELSAKLAGKAVPGMDGLHRIQGTDYSEGPEVMQSMRMAATEEKLWIVPSKRGNGGPVILCRHDGNVASKLPGMRSARCVAATKNAVFFGGKKGLYKFNGNGKLLRCYDYDHHSFPGHGIIDICEGGGKIYFGFRGSPHSGIAVLDPATDKISVLAPSSREATPKTEPVAGIRRIRWDASTPRLYACRYFRYSNNRPFMTSQYGWSPHDNTWQKHQIKNAPRFVVSSGDETLLVRIIGGKTEFQFVKAGQKLTATVPVPSLIGEPAWDEHRIWVPTSSGLYEVDRSTGRVTWLAYQEDNPFTSLFKHGNRLYVATGRGLYYRDISPTPASNSAAATASLKPHSATTTAKSVDPEIGSAVLPMELSVDLSLEDNAKAEVTITLGRHKTLRKVLPGAVQLDLTAAGDGKHHFYFHCPGYAAKLIYIEVADGKANPKHAKVELFRKRYVILRCAFNTNSGRKLDGDDVEEQRLALSHWTGPNHFSQDWRIWQKFSRGTMFDGTPYLNFHRIAKGFGFVRPAPGTSYEKMKQAPESGYRCENIKAEKGLVLYCRVNGNAAKEGLGYGKILVEAITEKPPEDIQVIDMP